MTWYEIFLTVQAIALAIGAILVFVVRNSFKVGNVTTNEARDILGLKGDLTTISQRMDRAGREMSDLATKVQGLPATWRADCVTRELFDRADVENRQDRQRMQRQIDLLWAAIYRSRLEPRGIGPGDPVEP